MNHNVDRAIVLRRVNYGESDRIITALTEKNGVITFFARGVRKQKSSLSAGIELLSVSEVTFIKGKSEMFNLTGANLHVHFSEVVKNMEKTNQVFDIYKKVISNCDNGSGQEYFSLLESYLTALNNVEYSHSLAETWVLLRILKIGGLLNDLEVVQKDGGRFRFDFESQSFYSDENGVFSPNDIKLLRILANNQKPVLLARGSVDELGLVGFARSLYAYNLS